jgi:hypothetical protein
MISNDFLIYEVILTTCTAAIILALVAVFTLFRIFEPKKMTKSPKSYLSSPESVNVNYRLQAIRALVDALEHEMLWSASSRKSVTLALLNHAMTNTEQDLSDALGYDASDDADPWDFTSPESSESVESPQIGFVDLGSFDGLVSIASNYIRLYPLHDRCGISDLVIAELGELDIKYVDGNKLIQAIDHVFAQKEVKVHWAEEILSDLNAKLVKISDKTLGVFSDQAAREDFTKALHKNLAEAGIHISDEDLERVADNAYLRLLPFNAQEPLKKILQNIEKLSGEQKDFARLMRHDIPGVAQILLRAELIKIADQIFLSHPDCSPSSFREQFLKGLAEAGIGLSPKKIDETIELAMTRRAFTSFRDEPRSDGKMSRSPEYAVSLRELHQSYPISLILAKLSAQLK